MIPGSLNFIDVLVSQPEEPQFKVSDIAHDDFVMFRYELQTISSKFYYKDEQ
jgi:hypothetical protein